jgi:hypothetical protein
LALVVAGLFGASDLVRAMSAAPVWARLLYPLLGGLYAGLLALGLTRYGGNQGVGT